MGLALIVRAHANAQAASRTSIGIKPGYPRHITKAGTGPLLLNAESADAPPERRKGIIDE
jgi:hypothetical protein